MYIRTYVNRNSKIRDRKPEKRINYTNQNELRTKKQSTLEDFAQGPSQKLPA